MPVGVLISLARISSTTLSLAFFGVSSTTCQCKTNIFKHFSTTPLSLSQQRVPHLGLSSAAGSNGHRGFPSASHRLLYHRNGFWFRGGNVL